MNAQLGIFIAVSCAAHAGALLWPSTHEPVSPQLNIGGHARSLRVTLARPQAPISHSELAALRVAPPVPAPKTRPPQKPAVAKPATAAPRNTTAKQTANRTVVRAPATPPPQASSPNVSERISAALQNQLAERFEYPWLARKRGWQGLVTLSVHVDRNGEISDWKIARTSGYGVLDRSALQAASRIGRLQQAAKLLDGRSVDLSIPVRYRLLDG